MPVIKCPNGKYRSGHGKCVFHNAKDAKRAEIAMFANRESNRGLMFATGITDTMLDKMIEEEKKQK